MIKLSILILTVPSRFTTFCPKLVKELEKQIGARNDIEILCLYDNKKRTVGKKRSDLVRTAQGEFLAFVDDDDRIASDYVSAIINALYAHPDADCVVFDCTTTINGKEKVYSKYSINYEYGQTGNQWRGKPAHTMVWRSSIAKKHTYADMNYGEDIEWVKRACVDLKTETRIDKTLYFYDFNDNITETRG